MRPDAAKGGTPGRETPAPNPASAGSAPPAARRPRARVDPDVPGQPPRYHLLRSVTVIDRPRLEVFPFFADAENLERITPSSLRFRIISPTPIAMRLGTVIAYRLWLSNVPFGWRTQITEWDPPHAFTDTQVLGPYHTWVHRHTFEPAGGGRTLMTDEVRYRLPAWPLGELALPLVTRRLREIFLYRDDAIRRLLEA